MSKLSQIEIEYLDKFDTIRLVHIYRKSLKKAWYEYTHPDDPYEDWGWGDPFYASIGNKSFSLDNLKQYLSTREHVGILNKRALAIIRKNKMNVSKNKKDKRCIK